MIGNTESGMFIQCTCGKRSEASDGVKLLEVAKSERWALIRHSDSYELTTECLDCWTDGLIESVSENAD